MKHFVQYHNVEKMGSGDSITNFVILTSKSVKDMMGNKVWLICGVGSPRRYSLCLYFIVDVIEPSNERGFNRRVRGTTGKLFRPQILLGHFDWVSDFLATQQNFSLGLREIKAPFAQEFEALLESSSR